MWEVVSADACVCACACALFCVVRVLLVILCVCARARVRARTFGVRRAGMQVRSRVRSCVDACGRACKLWFARMHAGKCVCLCIACVRACACMCVHVRACACIRERGQTQALLSRALARECARVRVTCMRLRAKPWRAHARARPVELLGGKHLFKPTEMSEADRNICSRHQQRSEPRLGCC